MLCFLDHWSSLSLSLLSLFEMTEFKTQGLALGDLLHRNKVYFSGKEDTFLMFIFSLSCGQYGHVVSARQGARCACEYLQGGKPRLFVEAGEGPRVAASLAMGAEGMKRRCPHRVPCARATSSPTCSQVALLVGTDHRHRGRQHRAWALDKVERSRKGH